MGAGFNPDPTDSKPHNGFPSPMLPPYSLEHRDIGQGLGVPLE